MENIIYPAIFHKQEGGYWVEFPDLPGCLTEGETLEEAYTMAGDALFVWFSDESQKKPQPSAPSEIRTSGEDFVSLVKAEPHESDEAVKFRAGMEIENGLREKHLNKNQAAQILGVDRSYFTYLVNGKKTPSPEMAKRIGLLLGFDWEIFYGSEN
ncbi:MAG TPA: type II toxin-antitoxin system HicB family antitoxin [Candidatus Scatosoma pullicola]|nr:type II toxin-antitoxin system HicB family antitoxin [Candidatus Scatosoma pullicola]